MAEQLNVTTERVDNIPIVLTQSDKMGVLELLREYIKLYGNWEGISLGWTTVVWLAHILSEGDHRIIVGGPSATHPAHLHGVSSA